MNLDDNGIGTRPQLLDHPIGRQERAIRLHAHEIAAQHGEDRDAKRTRLDDDMVASRAGGRQIGRPADVLELGDFAVPAPLVPHVVPQGQSIDAAFKQILRQGARDPSPGRRIFPIGHDQIEAEFGPQLTHPGNHNLPSRSSHDVANEKQIRHASQ